MCLATSSLLLGCAATQDLTVEGLVAQSQNLVNENVAKQREIDAARAAQESARLEAPKDTDLLTVGMNLYNDVAAQMQGSNTTVADFLPPEVRSVLGVNSASSSSSSSSSSLGGAGSSSSSRGSNSVGGGINIEPLSPSAVPQQVTGGFQLAADPYASGGIAYHNAGSQGAGVGGQAQNQWQNQQQGFSAVQSPTLGVGQQPSSTIAPQPPAPSIADDIGGLFNGWVSQVSGGLLGEPTAQNNLPPYAPPSRQLTQRQFDGRSSGATRVLQQAGVSAANAAAGRQIAPMAFDALPDDMSGSMAGNKDLFLSIIIPIAALVNEQIAAERQAIIATGYRGNIAGAPIVIKQIAERYDVQSTVTELVARVDTLPISLMLAQSIEESGWGTSRFAQEGNALFGQYTWTATDRGMVPGGRPSGETYRIKAYPTLFAAMQSYALNLNRHQAYGALRSARSAARQQSRTPSANDLLPGLAQYSGDPGYYLPAIRGHLSQNALSRYDRVQLAPGPMIAVAGGNAPAGR